MLITGRHSQSKSICVAPNLLRISMDKAESMAFLMFLHLQFEKYLEGCVRTQLKNRGVAHPPHLVLFMILGTPVYGKPCMTLSHKE